jgi:hypothetical protein
MRMVRARKLRVEGRLRVIEVTGSWGVYAGERIVIGPGESFRDDLGIKIREMFEEGATEALSLGRSPSERFELPNVRVTVELVDPGPTR